jgi:UDP-N-acetylmuramoylalanine--D-glutamate ligase
MTDWDGQRFDPGRRVLIIGAARQGTALAQYMVSQGAEVVLNDRREVEELYDARQALMDLPIKWVLGGHPIELLDGVDLVCLSGGVPLTLPIVVEALARGIPLSNDSQIFLESAPCKVIGITGSAGKTTTTMLVGQMAQVAVSSPGSEARAWVGGNIGNPLISDLDKMQSEDIVVMELSSFQLEIMTESPQIAAILNITPNHLDRHLTMEVYTEAKARIVTNQAQEDIAILNRDDPGSWGLVDRVHGNIASFGLDEFKDFQVGTYLEDEVLVLKDGSDRTALFSRDVIRLRGEHNLMNVLAACSIAHGAGFPVEAMRVGVEGFEGIPHRLELVRSWGGADWYNDSIATAPERAIAALRSFDEPLVLLAGGRDKDLPWEEFANIVRERVDHLILFGEAAALVDQVVGSVPPGSRPYTIDRCKGLQEAVGIAAQVVEPGDVVLMSPGGTSFDEFRDFEDRGEWFRSWVKELP